ncbi:MAG TPA: hypothetical protein VKZ39_02905 [Sphaerochaetaceae bacterium]|nr:hypothetical protein [Sphaerochaetaceae bacterium]
MEILSRLDPRIGSLLDVIEDETVIVYSLVHHTMLRKLTTRKVGRTLQFIDQESDVDASIIVHCSDPLRFSTVMAHRESLSRCIADGAITVQGPSEIVMTLIRLIERSISINRGLHRIKVVSLRLLSPRGGRT